MHKRWFAAIFAAAFVLLVVPVSAQRTPGATIENGEIVVVMPAFGTPAQVRQNLEFNDDSINEVLSKARCVNIYELNFMVRTSADITIAASRMNGLASCGFERNYAGATRSVELVRPTDPAQYRTRNRSAFAVNTSPFVRGGFGAQLDTLASQASQPRYQALLHSSSGMTRTQADEVISLLTQKRCRLEELPSGSYLEINYGVAISGRKLKYEQKAGDPPMMVADCRLSDGTIIYIGEFCSNVYFPVQSVVYTFTPRRPAPPVVTEPAPAPRHSSLGIKKEAKNDSEDGGYSTRVRAKSGHDITFRITVFNFGPDTARNVRVRDELPSELRSSSWSGEHVIAKIPPAKGEAFEFRARYRATGDSVVNVASAVADNASEVRASAVVLRAKSNNTALYVVGLAALACVVTHVAEIPPCGSGGDPTPDPVKPEGGGPIVRPSVVGIYNAPQGPPMFLNRSNRLLPTPSGGIDVSWRVNIPLVRISINTSSIF